MGQTVGIDLGTTNSVVAVLEGTDPITIINAEGSRTTPSIVAFTVDGSILVGTLAKNQAVTNPDHTIRSVKRQMGTDWGISIGNTAYNSQEISARILQKLKLDAEQYLGDEISDVVITVPAYFNDAQRTATKEAGTIAGLNVLRIVNEPTAAALAYGLDKLQNAQTILVFDLGGGTFDVSVLTINNGLFDVKSTCGDTHLGGDDWDNRLVDWLMEQFQDAHGIDLGNDPAAMQRLIESAEEAKISLSQRETTQITIPFITSTDKGPLHIDVELTRRDFQRLTRDLLERCREPFEQALADAELTTDNLDEVILVGGSTRMPAVVEMLIDLLGRPPRQGVNPDEVVALGAAVQAGVLRGELKDILLLDVTPHSLGIEVVNRDDPNEGLFSCIIDRNTTVPTSNKETYSNAFDNQTSISIAVLQGEHTFARENKLLGEYTLEGVTPRPRGHAKVAVQLDIDSNGIISVSAKEEGTNTELNITVEGHSALDTANLELMAADAQRDLKRLK